MEILRRTPIAFAFTAPCRVSDITVADDASTDIALNTWLPVAQGNRAKSQNRSVE